MRFTGKDWLVLLGIFGYVIFPIDILPDIFGPIAWLDDGAVICWGIKYFVDKRAKQNGTQNGTLKIKADSEPAEVIESGVFLEDDVIDAEYEVKAS